MPKLPKEEEKLACDVDGLVDKQIIWANTFLLTNMLTKVAPEVDIRHIDSIICCL